MIYQVIFWNGDKDATGASVFVDCDSPDTAADAALLAFLEVRGVPPAGAVIHFRAQEMPWEGPLPKESAGRLLDPSSQEAALRELAKTPQRQHPDVAVWIPSVFFFAATRAADGLSLRVWRKPPVA